MALLGFKNRFTARILDGTKRQTIRKERKHSIKPGEVLHLYTGLRTKNATKLAAPTCSGVYWVVIAYNRPIVSVTVYARQDRNMTERGDIVEIYKGSNVLNQFAKLDGFDNWNDMRDFWIKEHKGSIFRGILITW